MGEKDRWIGVAEAIEIYVRRLAFPEALEKEFLKHPHDIQAGMMWLSDHAIIVHESPSGLAFERAQFDAIMQQIKPVQPDRTP